MRENELLRLPTDLVDFHRNMIYLKNTKGDINHEIPMNVHTREILRELVGKTRAKGYGYIFTNPMTRKPYTTLKTAWDTACKQAGITNLRIRDLRHTFGTRAADAGAPLRAIQEVMGHSSSAMTERYEPATDEGKRRVVEATGLKTAVVVKMASKTNSRGNEMPKLRVRKSLKLQRVIGGPWRIRTSNQRIMRAVGGTRN